MANEPPEPGGVFRGGMDMLGPDIPAGRRPRLGR